MIIKISIPDIFIKIVRKVSKKAYNKNLRFFKLNVTDIFCKFALQKRIKKTTLQT